MSIDARIPKLLVEALVEAFTVQASTPIEVLGAKATTPAPVEGVDLAAVLGMQSPELAGNIALCFPAKTFLGVVNRMLGENHTEIGPDNLDAAGELLNILYASARVKMNLAGYKFEPALPTVVRGERISVSHGTIPLIVRIDCQCEHGCFHLEVSLRKVT